MEKTRALNISRIMFIMCARTQIAPPHTSIFNPGVLHVPAMSSNAGVVLQHDYKYKIHR